MSFALATKTTLDHQNPFSNVANREAILSENGWKKHVLGYYISGKILKEILGFEMYVRERQFGDILKMSPNAISGNPHKIKEFRAGSYSPMGIPNKNMTPSKNMASNLPEIANFTKYPSLISARPKKPCILIAFDSEWKQFEDKRKLLSWQFAVIHEGKLIEFVFLGESEKKLSIYLALGVILDYLNITPVDERNIRRYMCCTGWDEKGKPIVERFKNYEDARNKCVYVYRNGEFTHEKIFEMPDHALKRFERDWTWFHSYYDYSLVDSIQVCLVCHTGKVDISALELGEERHLMKCLTDVQGGTVTMKPIYLILKCSKADKLVHRHIYSVSLSVADTMCHAPAGMKSLKDLGKVVGVEKVAISQELKKHMDQFLEDDPAGFMEYASTDSVVTLLYASSLYGYNNRPPVTITSATACYNICISIY